MSTCMIYLYFRAIIRKVDRGDNMRFGCMRFFFEIFSFFFNFFYTKSPAYTKPFGLFYRLDKCFSMP